MKDGESGNAGSDNLGVYREVVWPASGRLVVVYTQLLKGTKSIPVRRAVLGRRVNPGDLITGERWKRKVAVN